MKYKYGFILCALLGLLLGACDSPADDVVDGYTEREPQKVIFTNASFSYMGDDVGEQLSDGWVMKFYTDMEIDDYGNPIGPGCVVQLLLNVDYNENQEPDTWYLEGLYKSQSNSGDFSPNSFVSGYMDYIDLPDGRVERADATFYADIAEGVTDMDVDLLDEGVVQIIPNADGTHTIEGILVGKKCQKRYFSWSGKVEPKSYVTPQIPNSTINESVAVTSISKMQLQDRGDSFYLGDNSYRCFVLMMVEESIGFEWGKPTGSGELLRLDLLVPWESRVEDGVPAGTYNFVSRNADTSIDKANIVPFSAVPGLPDCFTAPYWSGCWYVEYADSVWGENYARIDSGSVVVERGEDGSHHIVCELYDCSTPAKSLSVDVQIGSDKIIVY